MNSNLTRAFAAAIAAFGGVVPALAQYDANKYCLDPNNTAPYSADFNYQQKSNPFFGAVVGVSGTVAFLGNNVAYPCAGGGPIAGRIGFTIGSQGSLQSTADDNLRLTLGTNFNFTINPNGVPNVGPPPGGMSFARVQVLHTPAAGGNQTRDTFLYGINGINLSFTGRGGRFIYTESTVGGTATNNSVNVRLIVDVLADAARLNWRLTNNLQTTDTIALGLWFGQVVSLSNDESGEFGYQVPYGVPDDQGFQDSVVYTTIPGRRPLTVDERFPDRFETDPLVRTSTAVPPYVNFSINQRTGYGLQVINNSSVLTAVDPTSGTDQTAVDEFVIGEPGYLATPGVISGVFNATDPAFPDFLFNPNGGGNSDAAPLDGTPGYIQKWEPNVIVGPGASRTITAYYRSTSFDSSYSPQFSGYAANVDTPKSISTDPNAVNSSNPFTPNPFKIYVNVDNTGGFSNVDTSVTMSSVSVVLHLPAGMSDPTTGSRTITKSMSSIAPTGIKTVDFDVKVDPDVFGAQTYSVDITPNPGFRKKTITGTINVAAAPRLLIRNGPNLVSPPWEFTDSQWESVLGLALNTQFQAYTWDGRAQRYITQINAKRATGTWIVSTDDLNYRALGGTPRQAADTFPSDTNFDVSAAPDGASPTAKLYPGWNLVGNPYNYAFPLGQVIGVPATGPAANRSLTFEQLVAGGFTNGAFVYYDATVKEYRTITGRGTSRLQPNYGYWIFANQEIDLQFPPLYELFIRSAEPTDGASNANNWKLQLSAASINAKDSQNFVGIAQDPAESRVQTVRKPPMAPVSGTGTVYSYVTGDNGAAMSSSVRQATGAQTFQYNVMAQGKGPVTVSWPNVSSIPSNLSVTVTDVAAKKTIDARKTAGYTFTSTGTGMRTFSVAVKPAITVKERITSASISYVQVGSVKNVKLNFATTAPGTATVALYRGNTLVANLATNMSIAAGTNTVLWPMTDLAGRPVANGTYTLTIDATGDGGDTASYRTSMTLRR